MAEATDNTKTDTKKKSGVFKYLDNTFSEEGLRTDVKITLTNETLIKIIVAAVAATALSTVTYFTIKLIFTAGKPKV